MFVQALFIAFLGVTALALGLLYNIERSRRQDAEELSQWNFDRFRKEEVRAEKLADALIERDLADDHEVASLRADNKRLRQKLTEQRKHIAGLERVRRDETAAYCDVYRRMNEAQMKLARPDMKPAAE